MTIEEENKQLRKLVDNIEEAIRRFKAFRMTISDIEYTFQEWMLVRTEEIREGINKDLLDNLLRNSRFPVIVLDHSKLEEIGVPRGYVCKNEAEEQALREWIFLAQEKRVAEVVDSYVSEQMQQAIGI